MIDIGKYQTIKYKANGRGWDGADCFGLVILICQAEAGVKIPDYVNGSAVDGYLMTDFANGAYREFERVSGPLRPFDVLAINNSDLFHCGLVYDKRNFIHMIEGLGVISSRISDWKSRIIAAYRHKEMLQ